MLYHSVHILNIFSLMLMELSSTSGTNIYHLSVCFRLPLFQSINEVFLLFVNSCRFLSNQSSDHLITSSRSFPNFIKQKLSQSLFRSLGSVFIFFLHCEEPTNLLIE